MTRGNHYAVLGIDPGASADQVEKAYRYLIELYGDDSLATYSLLDGGELRQVRAQLREAYDVLRDPLRRLEYDVRQGTITAPASESAPSAAAAEVEPGLSAFREAESAPPQVRPGRARLDPVVLSDPVRGATLRAFREERGVSLREIADSTKISLRYLEYIEADRHDCLPAQVYLRGFLQEYAKIVGLEPRQTAESYLAHCGMSRPEE